MIERWTYEPVDEEDGRGFYLSHNDKTVGVIDDEDWARYIVEALIRDDIAMAIARDPDDHRDLGF